MTHPSQLEPETTVGTLPFGRAIRWYLGILGLGLALSVTAKRLFHVHPLRAAFIYCGALFLAAGAADWPRTAFLLIRQLRWFGSIREDFLVRWIMILIGVFLVGFAIVAPNPTSW